MITKLKSKFKKDKLQEMLNIFIWIFKYGKKHLLAIVLYTAIGFSGVIVGLLSSLNSKDLVDIVTGHDTGAVLRTFIIIVGLQLLSLAISQISGMVSSIVTGKVTNAIKSDTFDQIMNTEWETISAFHSGDLNARWNGDSVTVASGILSIVPNLLQIIFRLISSIILVSSYDPSFVIFAIVGAPITIIATRRNIKRMSKNGMASLGIMTKMSSFTTEAFSNFQMVKSFNLENLYSRKVNEIQSEQLKITIRQQRIAMLNAVIMSLVTSLVTYSTYGFGIYKVWSGAITYGTMTMFISLSAQLSSSLQSLLGIVPTSIGIMNSARRLMAISELPKEDLSHIDEVLSFADTNREYGLGLKINNIDYSYMNGNEVFKNVDFEANPHEIVALVGPSGQGKTTMLRLLLSLVHASEGNSLLTSGNGTDSMPLTASCRQLFSYVPQGNTMFSGTIAENLRFVKEDATDDEIIDTLKMACAWEFVEKLPDGINTVIKERGLGFSEGQAQRLSIARALIKKSPILLLDEATSALDVYTEKELLNNILNDDYPRTTIVTAHRLTVLRACNRVYKIHDKTCTLMNESEVQELMNM